MPHIHDEYDFVASAIIVFNNRALLVKHPRYGRWIPPGGHIELNEDPEQALFREIKEETDLDVELLSSKPKVSSPGTKFLPTPNFLDVHEANPPHKHIALVYFAKAKNDHFVKSDEHEEIKWFSIEDLDNTIYKLSESIKFYCKEAIKAAA